jgi:hypothetical protein
MSLRPFFPLEITIFCPHPAFHSECTSFLISGMLKYTVMISQFFSACGCSVAPYMFLANLPTLCRVYRGKDTALSSYGEAIAHCSDRSSNYFVLGFNQGGDCIVYCLDA